MRTGYEKIVPKNKTWWKHGNRKGIPGHLIAEERERQQNRRPPPEMFSSMGELMKNKRRRPNL